MNEAYDEPFAGLSDDDLVLIGKVQRLRMPAMASKLREHLSDGNKEVLSFRERIKDMIDAETDSRATKKINRCIKQATLKYPEATLDEKLNSPERGIDPVFISRLSECHWIREGKILTITGMTGTGKSYVACALAVCAIQQYMDVKYIRMSQLMNEIEVAKAEKTIIGYQNRMAAYDLLIIDDFGLSEKLSLTDCNRMLEILESRDQRRATIITFQFLRKDCYQLFKNNIYADPYMDRIVKGNLHLEMKGSSLKGTTCR